MSAAHLYFAAAAAFCALYGFPTAAVTREAQASPWVDYWECVLRASRALEKSGEVASIGADVAIDKCADARRQLEISIAAREVVDHPKDDASYLSGIVDGVMKLMDEKIRQASIDQTVTNKAARYRHP